MELNQGQKDAIQTIEGTCMLLAPPGSGKTLTMTMRIKYLIESCKVNPEEILVITFTRYAAREMKERFQTLVKEEYPVSFGTFHSVFYWILRWAYGLRQENLLAEKEAMNLLREILNKTEIESEISLDDEDVLPDLMREIGIVKNSLLRLDEFQSSLLNQNEFEALFRGYEGAKKKLKKFDFDDMMVQCYALLKKRPDVLEKWQKRFRYILIDEFQDINQVQYEVIKMLALPENNLFVVGDDDQSIYGFRGANPRIMLEMKRDYPELKQLYLTVNYRSTEFIVGASSRVIFHNESRYQKKVLSYKGKGNSVHVQEVKDSKEESEYITGKIHELLNAGKEPGEIAVLYRAGIQANMITEAFNEHQIPFEMREYIPNFYHHFIARDMLAYLKLAAGKRDRYLFLQICNRPVRYIARNSMESPTVAFEDLRRFYCDKRWMQDLIDQFEVDLKVMENMAPYAAIQYIRKRIGYDVFLKEYAKEHQIPWNQFTDYYKELEERAKAYRTKEEWFAHIETYTKELEAQNELRAKRGNVRENKVQLMTMHAAKGLEFENVFVIHANEGEIPYQKAKLKDELEEERRMFYVAMTRAKENLVISYITEKNGNALKPSRFVKEVLGNSSMEYKKTS